MASLNCSEVWYRISEAIDSGLPLAPNTREHLARCTRCGSVASGLKDVVKLLAGSTLGEPPAGFSERMSCRIAGHLSAEWEGMVRLGIGTTYAPLGSHMAHFWDSDAQFRKGVEFLAYGLDAGNACFVFGYDEANMRVLEVLRSFGCDVAAAASKGNLIVIGGGPTANDMLGEIGSQFRAAMGRGAETLRLLGNIGWGVKGWPPEDEILDFEAQVTQAARQFPSIVVCMYDVRNISGRVLFRGGLGTHPYCIYGGDLHTNPAYVPIRVH